MDLHAFTRQFLRNLCLAALCGQVVSLAAAFATQFSRKAWLLLPYGIDEPFGPLANIIRNSFWSFIALSVASLIRKKRMLETDATPAFLWAVQFFAGTVSTILIDSLWQSLRLGHFADTLQPTNTPTTLLLFAMGQLLAYWGRKRLFPVGPR